eukprot:3507449-Pyramimonas_sp.AAC.1
MEHLLLHRELTTAGWTSSSSTLMGASRGNLLFQHAGPGFWAPVLGCNLVVVGARGERADMLDGVLEFPV